MCQQTQKELKKFINFVIENKALIVALIITVILTYGYEMSSFALTIDEEANWNRSGIAYFPRRVADGRFFWGFIKMFFPRIFLPFWSTAVFGIGMVVNGCLIAYVFRDHFKSVISKVTVACIFVSFPVHAFYVMFSIMSAEMALCYFMVIWAVYLVDQSLKKGKWDFRIFVVAMILVILSNGIYQAFFTVYAILACSLIVLDLFGENHVEMRGRAVKEYWKRIGGHIVCLGASGIGYVVVVKITQWLIAPSRNHVEGYLQWGTYGFLETIKVFIKAIWRISWSTGNDHAYTTMWLFSSLFIVLLIVGMWRCAKGYKLLFFIAMCGLFLTNYLMMFAAGTTVPERMYITLPIFAAIVFAMFIELILAQNTKVFLGALVGFVILIQSANVTDLFWAEDRQKEKDEVILTKMTSEIAELGGAWVPEEPVIICNSTSYDSYDSGFGFSYFTLGGRIYGYLEYRGFDYVQGSDEQIGFASERVKTMPVFPEEGSIVKENGIIIVNLQ